MGQALEGEGARDDERRALEELSREDHGTMIRRAAVLDPRVAGVIQSSG
jgi:hypothetical protein